MVCCGPGLGFLPISLGVISAGTFITTYIISICRKDVEAFFPYISDTGTTPWESCIFAQFLNVAAFLAFLTMYVRYRLIRELDRDDDCKIKRLNNVAFFFAFFISIGMMIVANFQETNVEPVHLTGAGFVFGFGCVYALLHTIISYKMCPDYNGSYVCKWRLALTLLAFMSMTTTFIAGSISREQWTAHKETHGKIHWKYGDPGYAAHITSTISEWIMSLSFLMYFFTFIRDFQKISLEVKATIHVTHLDEIPVNMDERTRLLV